MSSPIIARISRIKTDSTVCGVIPTVKNRIITLEEKLLQLEEFLQLKQLALLPPRPPLLIAQR